MNSRKGLSLPHLSSGSVSVKMASTRYEPITPKLLNNKLFSFIVKSFSIGGYVMSKTQTFERWHYWRSAFITLSIAVCSIGGVMSLATASVNPLCLSATCTFVATSIAYINIFFRRRRFGRMFNFLQEDMEKLMINADEREKLMLDKTCKFMFMIQMFVYTPTIMAGIMFFIDSFYRIVFDQESINNYVVTQNIANTQSLLVKMFPFKVLHDDFCLGLAFPLFFPFLGLLYVPLWPITLANLMLYINLKWKIMHKRMSEMDISKVILEPREVIVYSGLASENDRIDYLRARLCKFCISEQIRIRWFMDQLKYLIQIPVFMDFMIYSIIICFLIYEIASGDNSKTDLAFAALFIFIILMNVWLIHWNGTLVSENSYAMCFAVYSSDWYTYSLNVQKMVLLIMLITKDPVEITAFVIRLHVSTFIDIIRAAYSYFHILRRSS